jgi:hypothetical protein
MQRIPLLAWAGWGGLGCYRGIKDYKYSVEKYELPYMYTTHGLYGIAGFIVYLNPLLLCLTLPKELYRLEVNLRGLEDEKHTDKYRKFI